MYINTLYYRSGYIYGFWISAHINARVVRACERRLRAPDSSSLIGSPINLRAEKGRTGKPYVDFFRPWRSAVNLALDDGRTRVRFESRSAWNGIDTMKMSKKINRSLLLLMRSIERFFRVGRIWWMLRFHERKQKSKEYF